MNCISLFERCTINDNFSMELDKPSLNSPNPDVYILGLGEQFEVKTIMGQGGSARVFRCIDSNNNQWALKVIKNEKKFNDEKVNKMISKEYYISTLLANHPNILKCHAVEYMGKIVAKTKSVQIAKFNVLEIAQNGSLHRFIRSTGGVEENLARFMFYQLASAVEFMHSQLIAHFDIKLDNILLDEFYNIKLADFGTAEILESSESRLKCKKGTYCYMAPEVCNCLENHESFSPYMADVYSLGVTLYAMLVGELPLTQDKFEILTKASYEGLDIDQDNSISIEKNFGLSTECRDLLMNLIHSDPNQRYTMKQVMEHPWINSLTEDLSFEVYNEFEARKNFMISSLISK